MTASQPKAEVGTEHEILRAPFPWTGGKSRVAPIVWERFGPVGNYIEPFAGSLAVLLGRPHEPLVETVNDADAFIANFWRATTFAAGEVAHHADWPVNEVDLEARHRWLVSTGAERVERLRHDPDYYDAQVAGWWVWGISQWIGTGWCSAAVQHVPVKKQRPYLGGGGQGMGVHRAPVRKKPNTGTSGSGVHRKRPHVAGDSQGKGVHRGMTRYENKKPDTDGHGGRGVHRRLPAVDGWGSKGVHAQRWKPQGRGFHIQKPDTRADSATGIFAARAIDLHAYFEALKYRLRRVRSTCGDWARILTPATLRGRNGVTGVFLDPPYSHAAGRSANLYTFDDPDVATHVREWALAHGNDPRLRIALCGFDGEHEMPSSWECVAWVGNGGMANRSAQGNGNRFRERIWFSPACLRGRQPSLFERT